MAKQKMTSDEFKQFLELESRLDEIEEALTREKKNLGGLSLKDFKDLSCELANMKEGLAAL